MRAVIRSATIIVLLLAAAVAANHQTLGTISCMTSNPNPTGCYCSNGCAVVSDTNFTLTPPVFPAPKVDASIVGTDTICAKITLPYITSDANVLNLAAYLGVDRYSVANSEVTVWTAFTQAQCAAFQYLAKAAVASSPNASSLYVQLCNTDGCNPSNSEGFSASPGPLAGNNLPSLLPGGCPLSNQNPTACYCTIGCSINGDTTGFPWKSPVWPPAAVSAAVVGTDTICAKITVPIYKSLSLGVNLDAYLGVSWNSYLNGRTSYNGGADGLVVTTYTAFTQAECAGYIAAAQALTSAYSVPLGVELCNTSFCNGPSSTNPAGAGSSSAFSFTTALCAAVVALLALAM